MKVPLSWLREFVALPDDVDDIVDKLTFSGIEVEGIEKVGEGLDRVVVGRIVAWDQHPNADRLRLCRVDDGSGEKQVVCGATNFVVGDCAAFAPAGSVLPNGLKLKVAKVRGEVSEGMLCAEDELGLSDDHDGILILPQTAQPGEPVSQYFPPDVVLALEVTWNRPDCLSIIGVARELAALYDVPLTVPQPETGATNGQIEDFVQVSIADAEACPRYTAHMLRGVSICPSPAHVQRRLALCGIRPINNIVDATNYVMLELGQPLHAFDYRLLRDQKIVVRRATAGEIIQTLDEVERKLDPDMLVIADGVGAVAVAGVMGGAGSEINATTKDVLIESAGFDPRTVRTGSVRLGLASESSHRFERGVDESVSDVAGRRARDLMQAWGGGERVQGILDIHPRPHVPPVIPLRLAKLAQVLGITVAPAEVKHIVEALQFTVSPLQDDVWDVAVPPFRRDVTCEADLFEEIARMHGIDAVPERLPRVAIIPDADDTPSYRVYRCRELLAGYGFSEAMHYSFLSVSLLDAWDKNDADSRLVLPNPVSADHGVMRSSLVPQLAESLARNRARQQESAALFEVGNVYWRTVPEGTPAEEMRLGIGLMGMLDEPGWQNRGTIAVEDVYLKLKGTLEQLLIDLLVSGGAFLAADHPYCDPGYACEIRIGEESIGFVGILRNDLRKARRMQVPVAVAEVSLPALLGHTAGPRRCQTIPTYPSVSRDLAAWVDESITHVHMLAIMQKSAPPELTGIKLFDIFRDGKLELEKKSMGYSLTYQSADKTLTDEEVNRWHSAIKDALRREAGAQFRE